MNREKILEKSREENVRGDEYERQVRIERDAFSGWGLIVLGIIITICKLSHNQSPTDIISLMFCSSGLSFTYEGVKLKNKWSLLSGMILLIVAAYFFYQFCVGLM